ncbi:Rieske 2Fe-2S domain-containing protein [Sphingomonas sp. OTU376]|uniref:Rieske 2Fe-2S domain-containing protein n=1 Tax=Sphingomonas sp. OTU376 TaxID=3043863 RepID=UPI00313F2220
MSRRRTHDDVRNETIVAERSGMLAHVARHRAGVSIAVQAGRMTTSDADLVNRQVAAFAESCAIGLHIDGDTDQVQALRERFGKCAPIARPDGRKLCPHRRADLSNMVVAEDGTVTCPLHGLIVQVAA